jgi:hypothetical protein
MMPMKTEMMTTSDRYIARLNIERFRRLLGSEADETKRQTILRLLHPRRGPALSA